MSFETEMWNRIIESTQRNDSDPYGIEYHFSLYDKPNNGNQSNEAAVNSPEWLVPLGGELQSLAEECGLEVILCQNFHQFIYDKKNVPRLR